MARIDFYHRTAEQIAELAKPWRMIQAEPWIGPKADIGGPAGGEYWCSAYR